MIARALRLNTTLETLTFSGNQIGGGEVLRAELIRYKLPPQLTLNTPPPYEDDFRIGAPYGGAAFGAGGPYGGAVFGVGRPYGGAAFNAGAPYGGAAFDAGRPYGGAAGNPYGGGSF